MEDNIRVIISQKEATLFLPQRLQDEDNNTASELEEIAEMAAALGRASIDPEVAEQRRSGIESKLLTPKETEAKDKEEIAEEKHKEEEEVWAAAGKTEEWFKQHKVIEPKSSIGLQMRVWRLLETGSQQNINQATSAFEQVSLHGKGLPKTLPPRAPLPVSHLPQAEVPVIGPAPTREERYTHIEPRMDTHAAPRKQGPKGRTKPKTTSALLDHRTKNREGKLDKMRFRPASRKENADERATPVDQIHGAPTEPPRPRARMKRHERDLQNIESTKRRVFNDRRG